MLMDSDNADYMQFLLTQKHKVELRLLDKNCKFEVNKQEYLLNDDQIYDLLGEKENGVYGILNNRRDLNFEIMLNKYDKVHNKTLKKEHVDYSYGIMEMYEITDEEIRNMNTFYFIKNQGFKIINNLDSTVNSLDNLPSNTILSKIYQFNGKIKLDQIIMLKDLPESDNELFAEYETNVINMAPNKKVAKELMNFDHIYKLQHVIFSKGNDINDVLNKKFGNITRVKLCQITDNDKYEQCIEDYYDANVYDLTAKVLNNHNLPNKLINIIVPILETLIRIHINSENNGVELKKELLAKIKCDIAMNIDFTSKTLLHRHMRMNFNISADKEYDGNEVTKLISLIIKMLEDRTLNEILELIKISKE